MQQDRRGDGHGISVQMNGDNVLLTMFENGRLVTVMVFDDLVSHQRPGVPRGLPADPRDAERILQLARQATDPRSPEGSDLSLGEARVMRYILQHGAPPARRDGHGR